ncbi:MAG: hypothetical protein GY812_15425 [Actinomycetia bacterium]|nr:hypothetical protein [Actinomycetes bacterium]
MSLQADLTSLSSTLDQMLERVESAAGEIQGTDRDDLLGDLYEIERHLRSANRRLIRALNGLPGGN